LTGLAWFCCFDINMLMCRCGKTAILISHSPPLNS